MWIRRNSDDATLEWNGLAFHDSGALFFEDYDWTVAAEHPLLFTEALASPGVAILQHAILLDWDFAGSTWVNTGALTTCRVQTILCKPDLSNGVDLATYDLINNQPDGDGSLVAFSPLVTTGSADNLSVNMNRLAATTHACALNISLSQNDAAIIVTGRFRVVMITAALS